MLEDKRTVRILKILQEYDGKIPLSRFLVNYFRTHPEMGSTDRRLTSQALYSYFRIGKALADSPFEVRLAIALFLCSNEVNLLSGHILKSYSSLDPDEMVSATEKKLELIRSKYPGFDPEDIFPFSSPLSDGIDRKKFIRSFLSQPLVWIRVVRRHRNEVITELEKKTISYKISNEVPDAISFDSRTPLTQLESYRNGYFEIQDLSSQKCGAYFHPSEHEHWWDCCAGSGGKSLLLYSKMPSVRLTVSDNRATILQNLKERFAKAGITKYTSLETDLTSDFSLPTSNLFDGIIADVPCSGSGTWRRTPEALSYFREEHLDAFSAKQQNISAAVLPKLKKGKPFLYITCSVFKKENEEIVSFLAGRHSLSVELSEIIKSSDNQSDIIFICRMVKV